MKLDEKILPGQPISYTSIYALLTLLCFALWVGTGPIYVQQIATSIMDIVMIICLFYRAMNPKVGDVIWFAPAVSMLLLTVSALVYVISPVDNQPLFVICGFFGYLALGIFPIMLRKRNSMDIILELIPLLFVLSAGFISLLLDGTDSPNQTTTIWFSLITLVLITLFLPSFLTQEVEGKESLFWIAFAFVCIAIGEFSGTFGVSAIKFSIEENPSGGVFLFGCLIIGTLVKDARNVQTSRLSSGVSQFYISGATMLSAITVPLIIIFGEYDPNPALRWLLGYAYFATILLVWAYIKIAWYRGNIINKELTWLLEHEDQTGILNNIGLFRKVFQYRAVDFYTCHISVRRNEVSKDIPNDVLHPALAAYFMFRFQEPNIVARLSVDDYCIISLDKEKVRSACQRIVDHGIVLKTSTVVTVDIDLGITESTDYNNFERDLDNADRNAQEVQRTIFPHIEPGIDLLTEQKNYIQHG